LCFQFPPCWCLPPAPTPRRPHFSVIKVGLNKGGVGQGPKSAVPGGGGGGGCWGQAADDAGRPPRARAPDGPCFEAKGTPAFNWITTITFFWIFSIHLFFMKWEGYPTNHLSGVFSGSTISCPLDPRRPHGVAKEAPAAVPGGDADVPRRDPLHRHPQGAHEDFDQRMSCLRTLSPALTPISTPLSILTAKP